MQVYANSNRLSLKTILFFIIVLFIAFLPISSFLFFLKNDAFNGYFPPKFFMSESIHAGYLPLWNPYINFGIPQYGDMSAGYWSPITWLIASTTGYNAYTLTLEVLLYLLLGGLGMYKLSSLWISDNRLRTLTGIVYMCCGYNIGHLQHFNWLSGAAFLPYCTLFYILLLKQFSIRNTLISALFFYMLISSAHPGISICAFYFFSGIAIFYFFSNTNKQSWGVQCKSIFKAHFFLIVILLVLGAGMIAGYLDILPHFIRGEKITLEDSLSNPTNIQSWISTFLPFATVKNDGFYNTDLTMRNCYFSLTLLLFFFLAVINKRTSWQKFLLAYGGVFALLSSGGIFKTAAYKTIPFIGYVRLNGEFRVFSLLCFILVAAIELDKFIDQKNIFEKKIRLIYYVIELLLIISIIFGLYHVITTNQSFIYNTKYIFSQSGVTSKIKALIDAISFYDTFWLQGIIQLFFLWGIKYCLKQSRWTLLNRITIINIIITSLFNIPYTGVGKASVAQVQEVLNKSPEGIPIPALKPILDNDTLTADQKDLVGDWSFYNKQIGVIKEVPYPVTLKNTQEYFNRNNPRSSTNFLQYPFVFITDNPQSKNIRINKFSPTGINISLNADSSSQLIIQQNYYSHWYYKNETEKKEVNKAGINFMSVPVVKGKNNISISFEPFLVICMMLLSAIGLFLSLLFVFLLRPKQSSLSSQRQ